MKSTKPHPHFSEYPPTYRSRSRNQYCNVPGCGFTFGAHGAKPPHICPGGKTSFNTPPKVVQLTRVEGTFTCEGCGTALKSQGLPDGWCQLGESKNGGIASWCPKDWPEMQGKP